MSELFKTILGQKVFAVTGYSHDASKFGNRVFWFLRNAGYEVYAVNPNVREVEPLSPTPNPLPHAQAITKEGAPEPCYPTVADVPGKPDCVVTVTQPWIT